MPSAHSQLGAARSILCSIMSSTSFRGKMALGSWLNTPLDPGINAAANIIKKSMPKNSEEAVVAEESTDLVD